MRRPTLKIRRFVPKKPAVSIILLDWNVRESFHSLHYLRRQTIPASQYELIWVEFYDTVPSALEKMSDDAENSGGPLLDQWIVVGATPETCFHKHYAYNIGVALAQGAICVICDSDAIYPENFVERILRTFADNENIVLHIDQIRNANRAFYPFNYPDLQGVISDSLTVNWTGSVTKGLTSQDDRLHELNYGACMAARRCDIIEVGGADEHLDYLGYICGPYELTFRLVNANRKEIWLEDIFPIHTWHPNEGGSNNVGGPNDGRGMSLRALEALSSRRIQSIVENPAISELRKNGSVDRETLIRKLESVDFDHWDLRAAPVQQLDPPVLVQESVGAYNVVRFGKRFYGFPKSEGSFLPAKALSGKYDVFPSDTALPRLLDQLRSRLGWKAAEKPGAAPGEPGEPDSSERATDAISLVYENIGLNNVVQFGDIFYGFPQAEGEFEPAKARRGGYDRFPHSRSLQDLLRKLQNGDTVVSQSMPSLTTAHDDAVQGVDKGVDERTDSYPSPWQRFDRPEIYTPQGHIADHRFAKVADGRKKITVVYNYYRKASTVLQSLESLENQRWRRCPREDVQIIIVDDGSEGEDIVDRLPENVLYVWQRKFRYGICRAKNTGVRLAGGEYIVFLDPDIMICPDYFDAMLEQFQTYGDRLVQCGYISDYHFAGCPDPRVEFGVWEKPNRPTQRFYQLAGGNVAISRNLYFETPGFDEDLIYGGVEDLLFGYHLSKLPGVSIMFNDRMQSWHIPHPSGAAHADPGKSWEIVKQKWPDFYHQYVGVGLR